MNQNDTNIITAIMIKSGFKMLRNFEEARVIFINTCCIRENAERNIRNRIQYIYNTRKKHNHKAIIGILGCMAVQLGEKIFADTNIVDLIVGPDSYSNLPNLVNECLEGVKKLDIEPKKTEHYDKIDTYIANNQTSGSVTIIRGCNNFCSYCVVPNVRGREKSKDFNNILNEIDYMVDKGIRSITLLGQNVNSYHNENIKFPQLLEAVAKRYKDIRISFLTSHPKDFSLDLLKVISYYENICNFIHLPVQSGSDSILHSMNRKYNIKEYISLINNIRITLSDVSITTDIISSYPGETLDDHQATLDLMSLIRFDSAFMFTYSAREGTKAYNLPNNISKAEKKRRLNEIIALQNKISAENNQLEINKILPVLVDSKSKKYSNQFIGWSINHKPVAFDNAGNSIQIGDIVNVRIEKATSKTLIGKICI